MKRLLFLLPFFVMGKSAVHTEYNYGRTLLSGWRYFISTLHSGKQECLYRHATNADTLTRQASVVFSGNNGLEFSNYHATISHTRSILKCDSGYYCMSDESGAYWEIDAGVSDPFNRFYSYTVDFDKSDQLLRSKVVKITCSENGHEKSGSDPVVKASWPNGTETDSAAFVFDRNSHQLKRMTFFTHRHFVTCYDDVLFTTVMYFEKPGSKTFRKELFNRKWMWMKAHYTWI